VELKPGAQTDKLYVDMKTVLPLIEQARQEALATVASLPCVITSGHEGHKGDHIHSDASLHYLENCPTEEGLAVDIRTGDFVEVFATTLRLLITQNFGRNAGFDIVPEHDHLHIERDPKKRPLRAR